MTPAIATIEALRAKAQTIRIVFIGRMYATEHHRDISHEKEEMDRLGIPFIAITTGRIQRYISIHSIVSLLKIPIGLVQAFLICLKEKPSCIMSYGGYVALPVVLAGWILGIPTITHEQTSVLGLANRIITHLAKKVCVTFPDMLASIADGKGVYTGLPIRRTVLNCKRHIKPKHKRPLVYITGGTTGATSVNALVYPLLPQLLTISDVIHQTGRVSYDDAFRHKMALTKELQRHYSIYSYVSDEQLSEIFRSVSIVVGRSGANTTVELATLGIPMICIPLPWSGGGEQLKNATWLSSHGTAFILEQHSATPELLLQAIKNMLQDIATIEPRLQALSASMPHNAADLVADEVISLL